MSGENQVVQLTMAELETMFKNNIAAIAKELGVGKVEARHGVFSEQDEKDLKSLSKVERVNRFVRAVVNGEKHIVKALSEGSTTAGGFLVPEEFRTEIIRLANTYGVVRRYANVFPTSLDTINLVTGNAVNTVAWTDEAAQITETTGSFLSPTITVRKLAGITAMSNELFNDEKANLLDYLAGLFAESVANKEDAAGLIGDGTATYGSYTGLLNFATTNLLDAPSGAGSYQNFTADDLLDLAFQTGMSDAKRRNAAYVMHPTVFAAIRKVKSNGEYVVQMPTADEPGRIWGYPVIQSEVMPSTDAVGTKYIGFGNMKRLMFADRQQIEMSVAKEATIGSNNLFEKDMLGLRVTSRCGMVWTLESALAVLKTVGA